MLRFIVDLITHSDSRDLERSFNEIYSPELEVKKENRGFLEQLCLDLMITIKDLYKSLCKVGAEI